MMVRTSSQHHKLYSTTCKYQNLKIHAVEVKLKFLVAEFFLLWFLFVDVSATVSITSFGDVPAIVVILVIANGDDDNFLLTMHGLPNPVSWLGSHIKSLIAAMYNENKEGLQQLLELRNYTNNDVLLLHPEDEDVISVAAFVASWITVGLKAEQCFEKKIRVYGIVRAQTVGKLEYMLPPLELLSSRGIQGPSIKFTWYKNKALLTRIAAYSDQARPNLTFVSTSWRHPWDQTLGITLIKMSAMANLTPVVTTVTKTANKEKAPDAAPRMNILDFCEEHYEDILPIIMEKARHDKRKEVQTRLNFGENPKRKGKLPKLEGKKLTCETPPREIQDSWSRKAR
ncbi:hypothetical protein Tco_0434442 [Tanacetum coccineum]